VSPKKSKAKVIESTGISFSLHDLRRTFTTIAESLDIPAYGLKRLLNHSDGSDVTAGYIVANVERLREPMQKIADYLLRAMEVEPTKLSSFELVSRATSPPTHSA
jgi:integrase